VAVGGAPVTPATPTGSNLSQAQLDAIEAQISGILKKASEIAAEEKKAPRKYFDVDDFPVECTSINSEGEKDLEIVRIVGFLTQAVRDLAEEVDLLKKNKK